MSERDDGGPAFPSWQEETKLDKNVYMLTGGMTLRDWFAGMALQGLCGNPSIFGPNCSTGWGPVNCTDADIVGYAAHLANLAIEERK